MNAVFFSEFKIRFVMRLSDKKLFFLKGEKLHENKISTEYRSRIYLITSNLLLKICKKTITKRRKYNIKFLAVQRCL